MTRALVAFSFLLAALAGCRSPAPTIDPFVPYGPQRVPPPVTGSIGTPAPQAAPYYQGSATTSPQTNNIGWRPPSTSLGTQATTQSQPAFSNTTGNVAVNSGVNTTTPSATFTASGGQTFAAPQVTNPATIGGPNGTGGAMQPTTPTNNAVFGSGTRSAQTQPWQPSGSAVGSPQLLRTNATPVAQPNNGFANNGFVPQPSANGAAVGNTAAGNPMGTNVGGQTGQPTTPIQPNQGGVQNNWSQPPATTWGRPALNQGSQMQTQGGLPLNGMPINDGTNAYPGGNSTFSMSGISNWFRNQFGQPMYAAPQQYGAQPMYGAQPAAYQAQAVPAGYSATGPTAAPLPVRGTQQNFVPAAYQTPQPTAVQPAAYGQQAPVAPAAPQWGAVPMAAVGNSGTTVRGNDDTEVSTATFVTTGQSSPTPHQADLYGMHEQYRWLRGQLEYSITSRSWKLRYIPLDAPEGRMDAFGGSVVLAAGEQLNEFQSGDFVTVQGKLSPGDVGTTKTDPRYEVESIAKR